MGLFDTTKQFSTSTQKSVTEYFLRKHGFKKIHWGSPFFQNKEPRGSMCWEKLIFDDEDTFVEGNLFYFPKTFTGYVTDYGYKAEGNCLGWLNTTGSNWELRCPATTQYDLLEAINMINLKIKEYYE